MTRRARNHELFAHERSATSSSVGSSPEDTGGTGNRLAGRVGRLGALVVMGLCFSLPVLIALLAGDAVGLYTLPGWLTNLVAKIAEYLPD